MSWSVEVAAGAGAEMGAEAETVVAEVGVGTVAGPVVVVVVEAVVGAEAGAELEAELEMEVGGVMGAWLIDGSWWGVEREPWLIDLGFTETQQQRLLHSWGRQRDADFPIANNCIKFEVCTDKDVFVQ